MRRKTRENLKKKKKFPKKEIIIEGKSVSLTSPKKYLTGDVFKIDLLGLTVRYLESNIQNVQNYKKKKKKSSETKKNRGGSEESCLIFSSID